MTQIYLPNIPGPSAEEPYQSAIRNFLLYLYQNGLSTRTISSYGWHLNKFGIWLKNRQVMSINELSPDIIIEWGAYLRSKYGDRARKLSVVATKLIYAINHPLPDHTFDFSNISANGCAPRLAC